MNYFALMVDIWTAFCVVLTVATVVLWITTFNANNVFRKKIINELENFLERVNKENKALEEKAVLIIESSRNNLLSEVENSLKEFKEQEKILREQDIILAQQYAEMERQDRLMKSLKAEQAKLEEEINAMQN